MSQKRATAVFTIVTVHDGSDGYSSAIVRLYRRSVTVLTDSDRPTGTLTYTFATGVLSGPSANFNGWSQQMPAEDADTKLYVTMATATSRDETDSIVVDSTVTPVVNEWSTPVEYTDGLHTATVMLYKRSATALSAHGITAAVYYRFADGKLFTTKAATTETAIETNKLNGWTRTAPETDGNPLYQIQATAVSIDALDKIDSGEWSRPVKMVEDGAKGDVLQASCSVGSITVECDDQGKVKIAVSKGATFTLYRNGKATPTPTVSVKSKPIGVTVHTHSDVAAIPSDSAHISIAANTDRADLDIGIVFTLAYSTYSAEFVLPIICSNNGPQGGAQTSYQLQVSTQVVELESNYAGVVSANPSNIILSVKKIEGSAETVLGALPSGYGIYYYNGTSWGAGSIGIGSHNALTDFTVNGAIVSEIRYGLGTSVSNILQQVSVVSQWNYQRMLVPAGEYTPKEYTRTYNTTPLVYYHDGSAGRYYFLIQDTNYINGSYVAPGSDSSVWQLAQEFDVILTKMLFAEFANLGKFIVYDRYFFSQYGTLIGPTQADDSIINANTLTTQYNGITPIVLSGHGDAEGIIICRLTFYAIANSQIAVTLTPSSEEDYDFGAVGHVDDTWLTTGNSGNPVTAEQIKYGSISDLLMKASGNTAETDTVTISTSGTHFIDIAYAKDVNGEDYDDNATFALRRMSGNVTWKSMAIVHLDGSMTRKGYCQQATGYAWFDPEDPMAETRPVSGYKFRPTKCIDALTGEEWGSDVHLTGEIHATSGDFTGTVRAHNLFRSIAVASRYYDLLQPRIVLFNPDGSRAVWLYFKETVTVGSTVFYQGSYHTKEEYDNAYPEYQVDGMESIKVCSYTADEIIVTYNHPAQGGDVEVCLPRCQDFIGKTVTIRNEISKGVQSPYGFVLTQCDDESRIADVMLTMNDFNISFGNSSPSRSFSSGQTVIVYSTGTRWEIVSIS